jgi:uncharacterized protein (DUF362 family)
VSKVVFTRVARGALDEIERSLERALSGIPLSEEEVGERSLVKLNAMSDELFPGRNTSPWVVDAVLGWLRSRYPRTAFRLVDTDVAGSRQFARACETWGYTEIAARHGVSIENLSHAPTVNVATESALVPALDLPRAVVEAASIINVPVLKTHVLSGITCALKNHWGLLPRVRYRYHPVLSEVIAAINQAIPQTVLNVVDATIGIEGSGPKTGVPRIANALFASRDRVAIDAAALDFIGMPRAMAPHVARAAELGVGSLDYELAGDPFVPEPFALPVQAEDLVSLLEKRIRGIPVLGPIAYAPPVARVLGMIGTQYNKRVWMNLHGQRHRGAIYRHPEYGLQFRADGR